MKTKKITLSLFTFLFFITFSYSQKIILVDIFSLLLSPDYFTEPTKQEKRELEIMNGAARELLDNGCCGCDNDTCKNKTCYDPEIGLTQIFPHSMQLLLTNKVTESDFLFGAGIGATKFKKMMKKRDDLPPELENLDNFTSKVAKSLKGCITGDSINETITFPSLQEVLQEISKNDHVSCVLVGNALSIWMPLFKEGDIFKSISWFEKYYISQEIGLLTYNPEFFTTILEQNDWSAHDCFLITFMCHEAQSAAFKAGIKKSYSIPCDFEVIPYGEKEKWGKKSLKNELEEFIHS